MGKANFHDPAQPTPINRSTPNLVRLITSSIPTTLPNLVTIGCWGSSGQWGEIYTFLCRLFFSFFLQQTLHLPVNMVRFLSLIRQTTCSRAYSCIDLRLFTPTLFWGVIYPQNHQFSPNRFCLQLEYQIWTAAQTNGPEVVGKGSNDVTHCM